MYIYIYRNIYTYICSGPPHDPPEPAFRKQWIMEGGQPPMRKHGQGSNFPNFLKLIYMYIYIFSGFKGFRAFKISGFKGLGVEGLKALGVKGFRRFRCSGLEFTVFFRM